MFRLFFMTNNFMTIKNILITVIPKNILVSQKYLMYSLCAVLSKTNSIILICVAVKNYSFKLMRNYEDTPQRTKYGAMSLILMKIFLMLKPQKA